MRRPRRAGVHSPDRRHHRRPGRPGREHSGRSRSLARRGAGDRVVEREGSLFDSGTAAIHGSSHRPLPVRHGARSAGWGQPVRVLGGTATRAVGDGTPLPYRHRIDLGAVQAHGGSGFGGPCRRGNVRSASVATGAASRLRCSSPGPVGRCAGRQRGCFPIPRARLRDFRPGVGRGLAALAGVRAHPDFYPRCRPDHKQARQSVPRRARAFRRHQTWPCVGFSPRRRRVDARARARNGSSCIELATAAG